MPFYEYRCKNGHTFEVMQRMSDDPVSVCQECGAPVQRVFHPVAVHFKGSGFYTTDYGRKKAGAGAGSDESKGSSSSSSDSNSSDSKGSESKSSDSKSSDSKSEKSAAKKSD